MIGLLSALQTAGMNPKMEQVMFIMSMNALSKTKGTNITISEINQSLKEIKELLNNNVSVTSKMFLNNLLKGQENEE